MKIFKIAIVGAGPAGYFAAQALQNLQSDETAFAIDMFERLPTPWGLVRSGVAPDHPKIKTVSKVFEKIANSERFRLIGNVEVGRDVMISTLQDRYDAVVIAVGTPHGRSLGIPGEGLKNVISSADFVYWYNGHPDYQNLDIDLTGTKAIVIGAGNVAMDVGRMLALDPKELDKTDTSEIALRRLHQSSIREVSIVARRGAEHAAFTAPELRELPDLESIDVTMKVDDITSAISRAGAEPEKHVKSNLEAMRLISETPAKGVSRKLEFLFQHKPIAINGSDRVESITFETPEGEVTKECDLLVTAIGYKPHALEELTVDGNHYRNQDGEISNGLYVVGWAKRGPSGVIGTNKSDAADVMKSLVAKLGDPKTSQDLLLELKKPGVVIVDQAGWNRINMKEVENGEAREKPRVKFLEIQEMLEIAGSE